MNREINDNEAENAFGGVIAADNLPSKFKPMKPQEEEELTDEALQGVRGDPIPLDQLPKGSFISKDQILETKGSSVLK